MWGMSSGAEVRHTAPFRIYALNYNELAQMQGAGEFLVVAAMPPPTAVTATRPSLRQQFTAGSPKTSRQT